MCSQDPGNRLEGSGPRCLTPGFWSALGFFLFDMFDRPRDRRDERRGITQGLFGQLELRDQHAGFIDNDQTIALIQGRAPSA
jgi:hypothetical protein